VCSDPEEFPVGPEPTPLEAPIENELLDGEEPEEENEEDDD